MKCIYCKNPTTGNEGEAHIFPEAIIQNDFTLPKGAVCDACNNYCSKLDKVLISHNRIASIIQRYSIKGGKSGKERQKITYFERSENGVSIKLKAKDILSIHKSSDSIHIHVKNHTDFDDLKFRRALYSIAFNFTAQHVLNEGLLRKEFDNVRRYIKSAKRGEKWPYGQIMFDKCEGAVLEAQLCPFYPEGLLVRIRIFCDEFYVDFLNPDGLHERLKHYFKEDVWCL